nr:MAG TPA: hypothetical protein [Caudoviricetes sp.]
MIDDANILLFFSIILFILKNISKITLLNF